MSHFIHTFVCIIKLFLGSEDLVKTNSHPGDPYSLIVEVSSKLGYNWQFCSRYILIYYLIHLIFSFNWKTKDVSTDDSGFYTCTAGNILGETASFKLFIKVEFCVIFMMHSSQLWALLLVAKVSLLTAKTNHLTPQESRAYLEVSGTPEKLIQSKMLLLFTLLLMISRHALKTSTMWYDLYGVCYMSNWACMYM